MRKPSTTSLLTISLLSLGLVGCADDPPAPSEVRSRLAKDLGHVLDQTIAATDGTVATMPGGSAFGILERAFGDSGTTIPLRPLGDLGRRLTGGLSSTRPTTSHALPEESGEEGGLDTDAIIAQLNETIFTDANHVGGGVYDVPAELACEQTIYDDLGNETTSLDPECVEQWDTIDLRIRVAESGSTLSFAVQVGAGHDEPLSIALAHDSLSVSIDLDEAEDAAETLAAAFGEQAPNARLAGQITGTLTVLGAAHVEAALTIDRALAIAVADDGLDLDGPEAFLLTSAAAQVAAVELDGSAGIGAFSLGLGETTVHIPGTDSFDAVDSFDLDLPGLSGAATLAAGQPLELTSLGLGDRTTTLRRNGALAMAIDLNPDDGRRLAATITADAATGTETLTVAPKLDVQIAIDHAALGAEAPIYDVTRVLLDGSLRGGDGADQIEVLTGSFSIATDPAQYGFAATAGQCVTGEDTYDATTGAYYTAWSVGACL